MALTCLATPTPLSDPDPDAVTPPLDLADPAASGGVGSYAVQLAKLGGHHVTATCGARNVDLVRSLGADEVLDYKTPEGKTLIRLKAI
ncbi:hypothetical protein FCM35_KLT02285 [Carex littledalei]|uniref:Alcohol dehydrogenase-like C-terminal domain-containing protein n=1 Tax=Carex littledalei TaxID=544730 RepID=A0A833RCR7_9POAL|nr:hypothetical protein FCM35_KLT02285 [Carex littledalei]